MLIKKIIPQCGLIILTIAHTTTHSTELHLPNNGHQNKNEIVQLRSLTTMLNIITYLIDMEEIRTLDSGHNQHRCPTRRSHNIHDMHLDTLDDITEAITEYDDLFINSYGSKMCCAKRMHAAQQLLQADVGLSLPQSYELPATVHYLLTKNNIPARYFTRCLGNPIQIQMHEELLEMLNQTATLHDRYSMYPSINNFTETIITFFDISNTYNHAGYVDRARTINDFCWALLEYGKAIISGTLSGIIQAHYNTAYDPERTKSLNHEASQVGHYMSKMIDELCSIPIQYCSDPAQGKELYHAFIHKIMALYTTIKQKLEQSSALEITEQTASFIAQAYMTMHQLKTVRSKSHNAPLHDLEHLIDRSSLQ